MSAATIVSLDTTATDTDPCHHHTGPINVLRYQRAILHGAPLEALCGVQRMADRHPEELPCCPDCNRLSGGCRGWEWLP